MDDKLSELIELAMLSGCYTCSTAYEAAFRRAFARFLRKYPDIPQHDPDYVTSVKDTVDAPIPEICRLAVRQLAGTLE